MLLAAYVAYLWMISWGFQFIAVKKKGLIDWTDRNDKSLYRFGSDWIKYASKRSIDSAPFFHFHTSEPTVNIR
jgi:hypothetical protein